MQTPYQLLRSGSRWFLIVLILGVLLRSAFVWSYSIRPFAWADLIHAHSHTAYFGWAGLGLMGLILHVLPGLTGLPVTETGSLRWVRRLAPLAVGGALLTFAFGGYSGPSIAFSALNEVLWYLFAHALWQNVRHLRVRDWPPALLLIGSAVLLLLLSTLGTVLVIVGRVVLDSGNSLVGTSGIYLFLQAYGDGWLEMGLMGVVAALLGAPLHRRITRWQSLLALVCMGPASLRLIAPFGLEGILLQVGIVAGVGLALSQALFLLNMVWSGVTLPQSARRWFLFAAACLALKTGLELFPLLPGWLHWAGERQLVIAFLHLKLLGTVTAALIGAITMVHEPIPSEAANDWGPTAGWALFAAGTTTMVASLALHGFLVADAPSLSGPLFGIAFAASVLAAVGAASTVWRHAWSRDAGEWTSTSKFSV